jgi:PKD repeat protein
MSTIDAQPRVTFQVKLYDLIQVLSSCPPDNLGNILFQLNARTIQIPGVPGLLRHGDTFSLRVEEALVVNGIYGAGTNSVLTIISNPPIPDVDFTYDPTSGDAPLVVQFTDISTHNPTYWKWDVGSDYKYDLGTQNITVEFTEPGVYSATLVAGNAGGERINAKSNIITVTGSGGGGGTASLDFSIDSNSQYVFIF